MSYLVHNADMGETALFDSQVDAEIWAMSNETFPGSLYITPIEAPEFA